MLSVSKVPVRYLAAARNSRGATQGGGIGIEATPPGTSILWNLKKILWQEARGQANFQEADDIYSAP